MYIYVTLRGWHVPAGDCNDDETMDMIMTPRCGNPDVMSMDDMMPYDMTMGMVDDMMNDDPSRHRRRKRRLRLHRWRRKRRRRKKRYTLQG